MAPRPAVNRQPPRPHHSFSRRRPHHYFSRRRRRLLDGGGKLGLGCCQGKVGDVWAKFVAKMKKSAGVDPDHLPHHDQWAAGKPPPVKKSDFLLDFIPPGIPVSSPVRPVAAGIPPRRRAFQRRRRPTYIVMALCSYDPI